MRLLTSLALLFLPTVAAAADPPVLLWGFSSECSSLPEVDRAVRRKLEDSAYHAFVLEGTEPHLGCEPARCAEIVRSSCPAVSGLLLGGTVYRGKVVRTRLWLYDLEKNRVAFQDDYTQNADIESALGAHAGALLDRPGWDATPGPLPLYCQGEAARASAAAASPSSRVYYIAYGERGPRSVISGALRQVIQDNGREAQPVPPRQEADTYTLPVLRRITGKSAGAQVLGAELLGDQKLQLWLFDSSTGQTAGQATPIECSGCDRDALIQKLRTEAKSLLGSCFGESCTSKFDVLRAPKEACEPLPTLRCGHNATLTSGVLPPPGPAPGSATRDVISPRLSRLASGALWGVFGAAAATSAGLFIANYSGAGTVETNRTEFQNTLLLPGGIMAGMAVLTLAIAIPTTVVLNRAATPAQPSEAKTVTGLLKKPLQCPQVGADREAR